MRAFQISAYGESPALRDVPRPEPGPGEICIRVAACGLNFGDLLMQKGTYQEKPEPPVTLGMEVAGVVDALGPGVDGPAPGTAVCAHTIHGGLAEYCLAPAAKAVPLPDGVDAVTAAGFQIAYGTSHVGLKHRARLAPGETLLVLGAAGGVGLTAVEIGKAMGARVIACARGAAKLEICRAAGADHLIDSETADIREAVKALGGADVVYDPVGGDQFTAAMRATNPEGRILVIGFASGEVPPVPANILMVKNIDLIGYYWGGYDRFAPEVIAESSRELLGWIAAGKLTPHVSHVLGLDQADTALALLRERKSTGKVVVKI
ncbi:MAG: zinc-binding dehydrogenase [Rhodobacterales bacterium]|nr:MAG: zinc-binding dehydrogenase [Rhodobacterales bacterium]